MNNNVAIEKRIIALEITMFQKKSLIEKELKEIEKICKELINLKQSLKPNE